MLADIIYQETSDALGKLSPGEDVNSIKLIYHKSFEIIRHAHENSAGGMEVAKARSYLVDAILRHLYAQTLRKFPNMGGKLTLIALGGYGRGYLNPYSDVDLLLLTEAPSDQLPETCALAIEAILYPLWDLGFKVGHASRNIDECLLEADKDNRTLTSLLEARLISGQKKPFNSLIKQFREKIVNIPERKREYLESRMRDLDRRHKKYAHTSFLQEPNIKESPGGLRDFHNLIWTTNVTLNCHSLTDVVRKHLLTSGDTDFLRHAIDFLHWIRNELHFRSGRSSDILTLQLQGQIATPKRYPLRSILRRTEAFMKDYYTQARGISDRLLSVLEKLNLMRSKESPLSSLLPVADKKKDKQEAFLIRNGLLYPENEYIFDTEPARLMRAFQVCQMRGLKLSPDLRSLIQIKSDLITDTFRKDPSIAETFQSILERKGSVARILRMMHRVGFLGKWLPEFGALDCLVQHEFFHRFTADEHTLRCIDQLDALFSDEGDTPSRSANQDLFRKIFLNIDDPYALYLSLLLHDSGRAENIREHSDGSAMLASQVCTRLGIVGSRRRMIMFLVDHHLTFWRYATTQNIDDPEVIEKFAQSVKTQDNLEILYLFTYVDSLGTNEESWSSWKDSLMKNLFLNTSRYFKEGNAQAFREYVESETERVKKEALKAIGAKGKRESSLLELFLLLPERYFRFRKTSSVVAHLETMEKLYNSPDAHSAILWRDYMDKGYTELVVTAHDKPFFIEKLCCALAFQQINILSAEIFTCSNGLILDIFRICTVRHEPVTNVQTRKIVEKVFDEILPLEYYHPENYLKKKHNFLTKTQEGIPFPVRAWVTNDHSVHFSIVELQARDRIGLLHDVFRCIGEFGLEIINARIATEKGAALDTIYITDAKGRQVSDQNILRKLEEKLNTIIA